MRRMIPAVLATSVAAAAFAGCGGGDSGSHVSPATAKASVERAAKVKLVSQPVPEEAGDDGLQASYTNGPTIVRDGQAVALFVLDDAGAAKQLKKAMGGAMPKGSRLIADGEVVVVYAPAGKDRSAAVVKAVKAL
jgi:hypothetical protein